MPSTPRLAPLLHPAFLASVLLLAVNDHVLKAAMPGIATGKLSDLAGLVVLPVLLCALAGVTERRGAWAVHGAVGAVFALMQFVAAGAWLVVLGQAVGTPLHHTADPTDLVALAVLPLGVWIVRHPVRWPCASWLRVPVAAASVAAVLGTSPVRVAPLLTDTPLVEAPSAEAAFMRMETRLRASGLDVVRVEWGAEVVVRPDGSVLEPYAVRHDSLVAARAAQGIREYRIAFRQAVQPTDTLLVTLMLGTQWEAPVLSAHRITAWSSWASGRRPLASRDELAAVVRARVLAPLGAAGVDTLSTPSSAPRR